MPVSAAVGEATSEPVQIARIMGLPRPDSFSDIGMVDAITKGVPARSAEHLVNWIDPSGSHVKLYDLVQRPPTIAASRAACP